MTQISKSISIHKPKTELFDYLTTPSNWSQWHPSSFRVSGEVSHSLLPGESFNEKVKLGFLIGHIQWRVRKSNPPQQWIIDGEVLDMPVFKGVKTTVSYTLHSQKDDTLFEYDLIYHPITRIARWIDELFFRKYNEKQSHVALENLKRILER